MLKCWKFHQARIKTKEFMVGKGAESPPPPLNWETSKCLDWIWLNVCVYACVSVCVGGGGGRVGGQFRFLEPVNGIICLLRVLD